MAKRKPASKKKQSALKRRSRASTLSAVHDTAAIDALFGAFARNLAIKLTANSSQSTTGDKG